MTESDITGDSETALSSPDHIYGVLSDTKRRMALDYLASAEGAVSLADLSAAVVENTDISEPDSDAIRLELHHCHLPKLEDAGMVTYDPAARTVRPRDHKVWSDVDKMPGFDVS